MTTVYRNLTTICLATVLAFGLAACGGGSSTTPDPTPMPDPAVGERATIATAIGTAQTAVAAVSDDSTDAQVKAADDAITAARNAIAAATNVPMDETAANTKTVDVLETQLSGAKMSRMTAMDDAAKAAAKDAVALFDGIDEATSDLTVAVTAVTDEGDSGGMASVTATGLTPGVGDDDVVKSAEPMLGMWQGTMLTDSVPATPATATNAGTSTTVVVYTDSEGTKAVPFGDVHSLTNDALPIDADADTDAHVKLISAAAFMHTGRMNHDPDPDSATDVARIRGMFPIVAKNRAYVVTQAQAFSVARA